MRHFRILIILFFIGTSTLAESEHFNMSLIGGFGQDYCTLDFLMENKNNSIDLTSTRDQNSLLGGTLTLIEQDRKLTCNAGKYEVTVGNTELEPYILEENLSHQQTNLMMLFGNVSATQGMIFEGEITSQKKSTMNDVIFSGGYIRIVTKVVGGTNDGTLNNIPDSYSYARTVVVTIDKID